MDAARMRELLAGLSCPLCGGVRGDSLLVVIDSGEEGAGRVRAQCVRCHLFWSASSHASEERPEVPREAAEAVSSGRRRTEPISADELLDLHRLLRDFQGSLAQLARHAG